MASEQKTQASGVGLPKGSRIGKYEVIERLGMGGQVVVYKAHDPLLDRFVDWGFDGIITFEPTAGMDLGRVRDQVGHELVLIGNLDVSHLLVKGSRREIEDAVKKRLDRV